MLEFADIPESIRRMIPNYKINIISIRDIKDTSIFKTDLRYVLEFLHHANNKEKLQELVNNDSYYQSMDEDAYDVVANYANVKKLLGVKDEYKDVEGRVNVCTAIREMMEDSRTEGRKEVIIRQVRTKLERGDSVEKIADDLVEEIDTIREIIMGLE